jgi:hypothetical protein
VSKQTHHTNQQQMGSDIAPLLEIMQLNYQGIISLQAKKFKEAIKYFVLGLNSETLKGCCRPVDAFEIREQKRRKNNLGDIPLGGDILISAKVCAGKHQPSVDDFSFALYNWALQLEISQMEYSMTGHGVPEGYYNLLLCGVLQYNIGLALHLAAFETGSSELLVKAIDFYERATQVLEVDHLKWGMHGQPISERSNLAFLAIANNLGQAHSCFRNFKYTNMCSTNMIGRLSFAMSSAEHGSPTGTTTDQALFSEQLEDFMLNASFFLMIDELPAPSA